MTPKAARQKGARWEKECCKLLGEWYYGDPNSLYRTAGSGTLRGHNDQRGDIGVARTGLDIFVFSVECKHVEAWDIGDILTREDPLLFRFWGQCLNSADQSKIPLLLLKQNHKPVLAGLRVKGVLGFMAPLPKIVPRIHIPSPNLDLFLLDRLLETSPADWKEYYRRKYVNRE